MTVDVNVMSLTIKTPKEIDGWQGWRSSIFSQPERSVAFCSYYVIITTTNLLKPKKKYVLGWGGPYQFKSIVEDVNINPYPANVENMVSS